jgi:hypothetical protein
MRRDGKTHQSSRMSRTVVIWPLKVSADSRPAWALNEAYRSPKWVKAAGRRVSKADRYFHCSPKAVRRRKQVESESQSRQTCEKESNGNEGNIVMRGRKRGGRTAFGTGEAELERMSETR